ncbi:hypothetical protein, partial [Salmonella enterica]|uniref:hypothetical protein n=1 Tax=Salmonella enterica TaxID=28901 RepID=UPI00398C600D
MGGLGAEVLGESAWLRRRKPGDSLLGASTVRPEGFAVVERIRAATKKALKDLMGNSNEWGHLKAADFTDDKFGVPTVSD